MGGGWVSAATLERVQEPRAALIYCSYTFTHLMGVYMFEGEEQIGAE